MSKIPVATYYFPNYHQDKRNIQIFGRGWDEWALTRHATPRFPGHKQPKIPLWGYEDEACPKVMAKKIAAAADHGIDCFIFDWYYYNDGPFLERCLDEGFLGASNNHRIKFALMWANHDWLNIHPAKRGTPPNLLYPGQVSVETFDHICDLVIERYFKHPSYWKIDGKPYFSVYELFRLIQGFGGNDETAVAITRFRHKVKAAGFPDLHLNAVVWGVQILPGEKVLTQPEQLVGLLGFDSVTSYVWVHHAPMPDFPRTSYESIMNKNVDFWRQAAASYSVPYYPNVMMGWDSSPRTVQSDVLENIGYPYCPVIEASPAMFEKALQTARDFMMSQPQERRILTINAWNEWTEGSYLEPDTVNGFGYLEAIKRVFGN